MTSVNPTVYGNSSSTSQQFCLKWNNHTANIVKSLTEMMLDDSFVDVTLACDGSSIKAHKVVLSACSNYFKELFLTNPCKHPIVILKDMTLDDLKAIINFMYKGEVNVSQNQLGALLKTAEVLKVKGLTEVSDDNKNGLSESFRSGSQQCNNDADGGESSSNHHQSLTHNSGQPDDSSQSGGHMSSSMTRKKKRRRNKMCSGSEADGNGSGGEMSSDLEDGAEGSAKRVKEIHVGGDITATRILGYHQTAPSSTSTSILSLNRSQSRRGVSTHHSQGTKSRSNISEDHANEANSSEEWPQNSLAILPNAMDDDEEEEIIDVKPIISFDEGSSESHSMSTSMVINESVDENTNNALSAMSSSCTTNTPLTGGSGLPSRFTFMKSNDDPRFRSGILSLTAIPPSVPIIIQSDAAGQDGEESGPKKGQGKCPYCFKNIHRLKRHINEVHIGVTYKCHLCSREFKRTEKLNQHVLQAHGSSQS